MSYIEEIANYEGDSKIFKPAGFLGDRSPDRNFILRLYLRVYLMQKNPPPGKDEFTILDSDAKPHKCLRWTEPEWLIFKNKYIEQSNYFWDKAFLLITPPAYKGFDWKDSKGETKRRNVLCHFNLSVVETFQGSHAVIPVVKAKESGFRSHSRLYDVRDTEPEIMTDILGVRKYFFTAPHEVGHLLGIGHPNENSRECKIKPNSHACYVGSTEHALQTMGTGTMLSLEDALPWKKRIALHTKTNAKDWKPAWASDEAALRGAEYVDLVIRP